jgi:hypothetical protein
MGYAMIASHVAPPFKRAATKVPQASRPGSILRHRGTYGTPFVEEMVAHYRPSKGAAKYLRGRTRAAGAFGLPRCAGRSFHALHGPRNGNNRHCDCRTWASDFSLAMTLEGFWLRRMSVAALIGPRER